MPRTCTICSHESRHDIDSALVSGTASIRTVAQQFGVSKDALSRHIRGGHVAKKIQKAQLARDALEAENLLSRIHKIYRRFEKLAKDQEDLGDVDKELKAYQVLAKYMEIEGKATGAFKEKRENTGSLTIRFDNEDQNL